MTFVKGSIEVTSHSFPEFEEISGKELSTNNNLHFKSQFGTDHMTFDRSSTVHKFVIHQPIR